MINYPNNKKVSQEANTQLNPYSQKKKSLSNANRGMDFEHAVTLSCQYYDDNNLALLSKRPTPIRVVKNDYKLGKITEAYFEKQSNTDYNGVYKGKYIDFECKETLSKTSLTFNNIPLHQIKHLKKVISHGGIAFFLIYFKTLDEIYMISASDMIDLYENSARKSATIESIRQKGIVIEQAYMPRIKFLEAIDKMFKF
jgi:recombination protein U